MKKLLIGLIAMGFVAVAGAVPIRVDTGCGKSFFMEWHENESIHDISLRIDKEARKLCNGRYNRATINFVS